MSGAPLRTGDVVAGRFRIESLLGRGGMGTVFAAEDQHLRRRVAVKVLLQPAEGDPVAAERLHREARSAVQLQSAHAARVFDVGCSAEGQPFIVMEYLEGEDLESYLGRRGPLPPAIAIDYVLQACEAVSEAHALGIIHRDLKPKNIFLTKAADGRPLVKVLDFGIAKNVGGARDDPSLTATNTIVGSPAYTAPELLGGARVVEPSADVWSLGVCLYQLLTGQLPFSAPTFPQVCANILTGAVPPLTKWIPSVAPELVDVVGACLQKDPSSRLRRVDDLVAALRKAEAAYAVRTDVSTPSAALRPPNEVERLAALRRYKLLDTPPDEDFTFLTEVAAALCEAPLAFVTLVDEHRVWYKAWHGIDVPSLEYPRDDDYCSWAILEDLLLHVPDLARDVRTATISTTIGEPHLRMYCGANLVTPDGLRIGTLCVVDTAPRELSSKQQRLLTLLARQVMTLIELRAKKEELRAAVAEVKRLASSVV